MNTENLKPGESTLLEVGGILADLADLQERLDEDLASTDHIEPLLEEFTALKQAQALLEDSHVLDDIIQNKRIAIEETTRDYLEQLVEYLWDNIYYHHVIYRSDAGLTSKQVDLKEKILGEALENLDYPELLPMASYQKTPKSVSFSHYDNNKQYLIWRTTSPGEEQVEFLLPLSFIHNTNEWENHLWEKIDSLTREKSRLSGNEHLVSLEVRNTINQLRKVEELRNNRVKSLNSQAKPLLSRFINYGKSLLEENSQFSVSKAITAVMVSALGIKRDTDADIERWTFDHIDSRNRLVWHYSSEGSTKADTCYLDEEYCYDPDGWEKNFAESIKGLIAKRESSST